MAELIEIHQPHSPRVDSIARIIRRFSRLDQPAVRHLTRKPVSAEISLRVYREDGSLFDQGSAELMDLSIAGARIGKLQLSRGDILPPNSRVNFSLSERSPSIPMQGKVVWLRPEPDRTYGIRFLPLEAGLLKGTPPCDSSSRGHLKKGLR
jgi:hypothetical protein